MDKGRPRLSILDSRFVYVPAARTDIKQTFARYRQEQHQAVTDAFMEANKESTESIDKVNKLIRLKWTK